MPEDPGAVYRVCFAQKDLERLRAWAKRADRLGMGKQYIEVLKTVQQKLANEG